MEPERLALETEARAEGRRVTGDVMVYGESSPSHRERFEPRSLVLAESVSFNLYHDAERSIAWHPGGGLSLDSGEDALRMVAVLPPIPAADRALAEIASGRTKGLSIEFRKIRDRFEDGLRIVESAELRGIALVPKPSYLGSKVEIRQRSGRTLRAVIPSNTNVDCRCSGSGCQLANITGDAINDMLDEVFEREVRDVVAAFGSYDQPLASVANGTVRGRPVEGGAQIEVDIPVGPEGDAVLRAQENAGVVLRPHVDPDLAESVIQEARQEQGNVRVYSKLGVRAFVISATDARRGWPAPEIVDTPGFDSLRWKREAAVWL